MSARGDVAAILRRATKAGAVVERMPNSHWRVTNPATGERVQVAFSPGSGAGVRNVIVKLRRIGVTV